MRFFVGVFGFAAAAAVYVSKDIIWLLLTAYSFFVPGVALPLLIALIGRVRRLNAQLWTAGAVFGGIGGLVGNVTGDEVWTLQAWASRLPLPSPPVSRRLRAVRTPSARSAERGLRALRNLCFRGQNGLFLKRNGR